MNAWDEVMQQPYYTAETLNTVANSIEAYMKTGQPKNESLSNFFIAAAHASDVCEYIRDKRKPDFDLLPYENDEADIDAAFGYWRLRGLFGEDAQGFPAQNAMHLQLGDITAIPVSSEQMQKGQSQLVKKASCFFLFYFWNLFHQKLGNAYDMAFSINSIMIPALQNYAFTQLGITLKKKRIPPWSIILMRCNSAKRPVVRIKPRSILPSKMP